MNIDTLEKEMLNAINIERKGVEEENSFTTLETIDFRFDNLQNFLQKLCKEYRGEE
jgi:hypothetical protein